MVNNHSVTVTAASRFGPDWVKPIYDSYGFARIADTLRRLHGLPARAPLPSDVLPSSGVYDRIVYDRIVCFLIDAFGWRFLEQFAGAPFLKEALSDGVVSRLTAMFPSTTAVHLTAIHTGLDTVDSGIVEWFYYEPALDEIIAPLLFSRAGDKERERLASEGVRAERIFPQRTLYHELAEAGVRSYVFGHRDYAQSSYSAVVTAGAQQMPYRTWPEALTNLTLLLDRDDSRSYYFLYFGEVDGLGHQYGPGSPQLAAESECLLMLMGRFLAECRRRHPRTLILLTADHGLCETDPATTIYLNRRIADFESFLKTDRRGRSLLFGGSPRDLFLYIRDELLEEAEGRLARELAGRAEVWRTAELARRGMFGAPSRAAGLLARTGNLMVLPHRHESVSWYEKGRFEQTFYGHHGGLTSEEMLIPFVAVAT
jgi:hypothetical protein